MTAEAVRGRRKMFDFPDPVNEKAVRVTAAGVALMALVAIVLQRPEPLVVIAYGFCARAAAGPRFSPLALFATRVAAPRLGPPTPVAGPPKRFAQLLGATFSLLTVVFAYGFGWTTVAFALAGVITVLATLEAGLRICVGCIVHAWLVRRNVINAAECATCADLSLRTSAVR